MLTTAVTAAIAAVLTWAGIPPGPYLAGVWIGVKVVIVALAAFVAWRAARRASRRPGRGAAGGPSGGAG